MGCTLFFVSFPSLGEGAAAHVVHLFAIVQLDWMPQVWVRAEVWPVLVGIAVMLGDNVMLVSNVVMTEGDLVAVDFPAL